MEWNGGYNCASVIVEIANKIGYPMDCKNHLGDYVFGPNIPALCKFL